MNDFCVTTDDDTYSDICHYYPTIKDSVEDAHIEHATQPFVLQPNRLTYMQRKH